MNIAEYNAVSNKYKMLIFHFSPECLMKTGDEIYKTLFYPKSELIRIALMILKPKVYMSPLLYKNTYFSIIKERDDFKEHIKFPRNLYLFYRIISNNFKDVHLRELVKFAIDELDIILKSPIPQLALAKPTYHLNEEKLFVMSNIIYEGYLLLYNYQYISKFEEYIKAALLYFIGEFPFDEIGQKRNRDYKQQIDFTSVYHSSTKPFKRISLPIFFWDIFDLISEKYEAYFDFIDSTMLINFVFYFFLIKHLAISQDVEYYKKNKDIRFFIEKINKMKKNAEL